jgi:predicted nucleic acid-binding protein
VSYLLDTNILLRLAQRKHPLHAPTRAAIVKLLCNSETLHIVPQNVYEGWVVATRPLASNGLGLSPSTADRLIQRSTRFCQLLLDAPTIYEEWRRLVTTYSISGVNAHDTRLVAAMKVHGIQNLLTFNVGDFQRFAGTEINVISPTTLIAATT